MISHSQVFVVLTFLALAINVFGKMGYGPGEQDWGYIEVRKGAHMFYWLYQTTAKVANYTDRPLVIFLEGGPGGSSTGHSNFGAIGPLDVYGNYRNFTWVKDVNVLFIDNPVGAGFSYVDETRLLTKTNKEIALDLVEFMKGFFAKHSEFEKVPLHIFGGSYGGKMAPEFALELYNAIERKEIKSNLTSAALGSAWISPIDAVLNWAPFMLNMGLVDKDGYKNVMAAAKETLRLVENEKWIQAFSQWNNTRYVASREAKGVDLYNIHRLTSGTAYEDLMYRSSGQDNVEGREVVLKAIETLMRGSVAKALGIPSKVEWGSQSELTQSSLSGDFMKPVIHVVNELLDKTNITVAVYSGQLDLICATAGAVDWVEKLQWKYRDEYVNALRQGINVNGILEGYKKSAKNFFMFWVNRAGHEIPIENPAAMNHILKKLTHYDQ